MTGLGIRRFAKVVRHVNSDQYRNVLEFFRKPDQTASHSGNKEKNAMKEDARKRLERLLQDLQEIQEASSEQLQCSVISSDLASPLRDHSAWQRVAEFVWETRDHDAPIVIDPEPIIAEPNPDNTGCIRWCGDSDKREAFKAWLARLSGFFESNSELVPNSEPRYGIDGGLLALCAIAALEPKLSERVKHRTILDLNQDLSGFGRIPAKLLKMSPKPIFTVVEIGGPISLFSLNVLKLVLGQSLDQPPLFANIEKSQVVIRGDVFPVDLSIVHIIDQLVQAKGNPISRKTMQANAPVLADEPRLDRVISKIRDTLHVPIESSKSGYSLPPDWLA